MVEVSDKRPTMYSAYPDPQVTQIQLADYVLILPGLSIDPGPKVVIAKLVNCETIIHSIAESTSGRDHHEVSCHFIREFGWTSLLISNQHQLTGLNQI